MKKILFVGGGHANTLSIRLLNQKLLKNTISQSKKFELLLLSESGRSAYSGMVPGSICTHYSKDDVFLDLRKFSMVNGCEFHEQKVVELKPNDNKVMFENGGETKYDILCLDVGSKTFQGNNAKGVDKYALQTRPINTLLDKIERIGEDVVSKLETDKMTIGIVGSGVAGLELGFSMKYRMKTLFNKDVHVELFSKEKGNVAKDVEPEVVEELTSLAKKEKINVTKDAQVMEVDREGLKYSTSNNEQIYKKFDLVVWATGAGAQDLNIRSNLDLNKGNFILVDDTLQSINYPNIFGTGDCIQMAKYENGYPPKAGVYAIREAAVLADNLYSIMANDGKVDKGLLKAYVPQTTFLKLITMGDRRAFGTKFGITFHGRWVWNLKEFIDTNFVKMLTKDLSYESNELAEVMSKVEFDFTPEKCISKLKESQLEEDFTVQLKIIDRLAQDENLLKDVNKLI